MPLNPFHGFRKHQKTLLAVLTIFTMFIFILTGFSGGLGSRGNPQGRNMDKPVVKMYGEELSANDIDRIAMQRRMANYYMLMTVQRGHEVVVQRAENELLPMLKDEKDMALRESVKMVVDSWTKAFKGDPKTKRGPTPLDLIEYYRIVSDDSQRSPRRLLSFYMFTVDKEKKVQREILELVVQMLAQDRRLVPLINANFFQQYLPTLRYIDPQLAMRIQMMLQMDPLYFGGGSLNNARDLVDFKIWLHEADRLGIRISEKALQEMIAQEALKTIGDKIMRETVNTTVANFRPQQKPEYLEQSLRDEFRVRLARVAVLGYEATMVPGVPLAVTPYDVAQYFTENRTEKTVALLPVPAEQVAATIPQPPDAELKALYEKYKNREADPGSPEPGFKQPPRRSVEWIAAKTSQPFYKEEAKKAEERVREAVLASMQVAAGGLSSTGQVTAAPLLSILPKRYDLPLEAAYQNLPLDERHNYRTPSWLDNSNSKLHTTSLNRPENVAALVGQAIGVGGTKGTILSAPAAFQAAGWTVEAKQRARRWSELFLAGTSPAPFLPITAPAVAWTMEPKRDYIPLKSVKPQIEEALRERLAKQVIDENFNAVRDELERLNMSTGESLQQKERASDPKLVAAMIGQAAATSMGNPWVTPVVYSGAVTQGELKIRSREAATRVLFGTTPTLAAAQYYERQTLPQQRARAYLAEAIKKYGFEHGQTEKPRDRFEVLDDKGLKPLRDAYLKPRPAGHDFLGDNKPKDFYRLFFDARSRFGLSEFYQPNKLPNSFESMYYWVTGEEPAYTPSFEEAKNRVAERWKLSKAGIEAKKKAEQIAAEVKKRAGGNGKEAVKVLREYAGQLNTNIVTLDKVSRLTSPATPVFNRGMMGGGEYQRYRIPDEKVEYPSGRFLDEILKLGTEGEVKVLHNRPETTYYVAVLEEKPLTPDFFGEYSLQMKGRALMDQYEQDEHLRLKFQEGVMAQLEKAAKLDIDAAFEKSFNGASRRDE
jgi:hypothetical protein